MLSIANHKNLAKLTVHYNKLCLQFEIGKFMVYLFTVHCIVYSKLLLLTSLQVYGTSDSLQQIVTSNKSLTNQLTITLFHC